MKKLILASSSPRRKRILEENNFDFIVIPADIDEELYENLDPLEMVQTLSSLKAQKIAKENDGIIIGADTTVSLNGEILSKPKSTAHAFEMLKKLSGSTHQVITGFTIIDTTSQKLNTFHEITYVTFNQLTDDDIKNYIENNDVLGFAGSYGIQDGADKFAKEIKGDFLNVVGLPTKAINEIKKALK